MKIGYPCVNESLDCTSTSTFRLASYTDERLELTVRNNLNCLLRILEFNVAQGMLFFRIGSGVVPFGSHPVNTFPWQTHFAAEFRAVGDYIKAHNMRVSFHPDQFVVLNSPDAGIVERSIAELVYQGSMLDLMGLDSTHKLQIHVGGLYGDRELAISRFIATYHRLPAAVTARLVIENDDRLFSLQDCLRVHEAVGIPILFDNFHHECLNHGESMSEALRLAAGTWHPERDGTMMMDYSSQAPGERKGKHTTSLVEELFREFLTHLQSVDPDIMLEIKDKEISARRAVAILHELGLASPTPQSLPI
ncbi:UV DNA damage repair endonuclease UvsE [Hymenobacter taeanensis]|uniref:UV DNA damage repair endonuclease UvsE n=1 Tax=Hymenobacter taeanensis TaxID=2735321 RepID=A0A6M6BH50_9BACT|nr:MULTISPECIES: UV DNA damage repair endonuclease UvsE [Hymenobacter]QJX47379.1 UV DNA damage repair endonuclease UvsE [Hymenobacter taeanensis]UOQ79281.1 UV DNA damage repair endonuclease UvsE [Hymenobacter sp. 5414T-23]